MKGLSYSPVSTSTTYISSSQVTTLRYPDTFYVRISINANCEPIHMSDENFKKAVQKSCSKVLNIEESDITIRDIKCGSIVVDMDIKNANNENITEKLTDSINNNQLNISYKGKEYTVSSVMQLPTPTNTNDGNGDDHTALILYIVFGSVLGLAFLIGITALIVRCRHERSTGMFQLPSEENLELSGFSDRHKTYRGGNFYGELQPESNQLSGIHNESDQIINDTADDTDNGGTFSEGYLPAWKNLQTVNLSDVAHEDGASEANENLVMYGNTDGEKAIDSSRTDVVSYENIGAV